MKKTILMATFLVANALSVFAQGELYPGNGFWLPWDVDPGRDRTIKDAAGVPIIDTTWSVSIDQLVGGNWEPIGAKLNFMGAGLDGCFDTDGATRVAAVSTLSVAVYDGSGALLARGGGQGGVGTDFQYAKRSSTPPSPTDTLMINFYGFTVPEPSTIALGVLGLGALLLFRRRK
jgi:hypothetical protein